MGMRRWWRERRQRAERIHTQKHTQEKRMISLALAGLSFGEKKNGRINNAEPRNRTPEPRIIYQDKKRERISRCCDLSCWAPALLSLVIFTSGQDWKDKEIEFCLIWRRREKEKRHTGSRMLLFMGRCHRKEKPGASTSPYIFSPNRRTLVVYISPIVLYIERGCVCVCMRDYILSQMSCCLYSPGCCVRLALSKYQQAARAQRAQQRPRPPARLYTAGCLGPAFVPIKWSVLTRCTIFHPSLYKGESSFLCVCVCMLLCL